MATKSKSSKSSGTGKTSSDNINQRDDQSGSSAGGRESARGSRGASQRSDNAQFEGQGGLTSTDSDVAGEGSTFNQRDANEVDRVGESDIGRKPSDDRNSDVRGRTAIDRDSVGDRDEELDR